ncbi:unnamed protein product [Periconia digitata]|uniref:Uncharacterized protein n=1 Tax=Periconia digitata TaxID=1303443 RepID=A0A9W4UKI8_9PLEO|nr:unnamed protein product [Periconia digitata]
MPEGHKNKASRRASRKRSLSPLNESLPEKKQKSTHHELDSQPFTHLVSMTMAIQTEIIGVRQEMKENNEKVQKALEKLQSTQGRQTNLMENTRVDVGSIQNNIKYGAGQPLPSSAPDYADPPRTPYSARSQRPMKSYQSLLPPPQDRHRSPPIPPVQPPPSIPPSHTTFNWPSSIASKGERRCYDKEIHSYKQSFYQPSPERRTR